MAKYSKALTFCIMCGCASLYLYSSATGEIFSDVLPLMECRVTILKIYRKCDLYFLDV